MGTLKLLEHTPIRGLDRSTVGTLFFFVLLMFLFLLLPLFLGFHILGQDALLIEHASQILCDVVHELSRGFLPTDLAHVHGGVSLASLHQLSHEVAPRLKEARIPVQVDVPIQEDVPPPKHLKKEI